MVTAFPVSSRWPGLHKSRPAAACVAPPQQQNLHGHKGEEDASGHVTELNPAILGEPSHGLNIERCNIVNKARTRIVRIPWPDGQRSCHIRSARGPMQQETSRAAIQVLHNTKDAHQGPPEVPGKTPNGLSTVLFPAGPSSHANNRARNKAVWLVCKSQGNRSSKLESKEEAGSASGCRYKLASHFSTLGAAVQDGNDTVQSCTGKTGKSPPQHLTSLWLRLVDHWAFVSKQLLPHTVLQI
ncbi:hypothetical protein ABBQ32_010713 [Trebouxia sp. C0010 RCD-2024]